MSFEYDKIKTFTDLNAWKNGHELILDIYKTTNTFPQSEIFGITSQIRRSAVSITSNIAEGFSRQSYKEKIQFYSIAQGSLTELQSQLLIARDVGYMNGDSYDKNFEKTITTHKLIGGLIKKSKQIHQEANQKP